MILILYIFLQSGSYDILNPALLTEKDIYIPYDDREAKGNSQTDIKIEDGGLDVSFNPQTGVEYPYSGVSFPLRSDYPFYITDYNCIHLSLKVKKVCKLLLLFSQHERGKDQKLNILQHAEYLLTCYPDKEDYSIQFSQFKIPGWWLKSNNLNENVIINWSEINIFSIQNDPLMAEGLKQELSVEQINFENRVNWPLYILLIFMLIVIATEVFIYKRVRKVEINYIPVSASELNIENPWEVLANYIASHYREDIDLEIVYKQTGLSKHKISSLIKEKTSLNFRQYINTIRIKEAERLFKTTSLSVTEIGYEVGYSSATQFNRVFREIKGIAPSEFKKTS